MYSSFERQEKKVNRSYERTTYEYEQVSDLSDIVESTYRSTISPRVAHPSRSRPFLAESGVTTRHFQCTQISDRDHNLGGWSSLANLPGLPIPGRGNTNTVRAAYTDLRQRDKCNLISLNDKFAQYIELVRFLEAQNRKLLYEIELMQQNSGHGSSRIKEIYQIEIDEAKKLLTDTKVNKNAAETKGKAATDELRRYEERLNHTANIAKTDRNEIENLRKRVVVNEAEINLFRRRIADLEDEGRRYKAESQYLNSKISLMNNKIQNARMAKISCEANRHAIEDEITALRQQYKIELERLRKPPQSDNLDPTKFLDKDLANQLRKIRADYENEIANQRSTLQSRHSIEVTEIVSRIRPDAHSLDDERQARQRETIRTELTNIQSQNIKLSTQNSTLRNRVEAIASKIGNLKRFNSLDLAKLDREILEAKERVASSTRKFDELASLKMTLQTEIDKYKNLLEGQNGLRPYIDRITTIVEQPLTFRGSDSTTNSSRTTTAFTHRVISGFSGNTRIG